MIYKVFLDINIIIDFFVTTRKQHKDAVEIFYLIENKLLRGYLSESVIATTAWLLRKDYPNKQFRLILNEMLDFFTVLGCSNETCKAAYASPIIDIEDAILYQVAARHQMDYFISNDKDFKNANQKNLPVVTSTQMISVLKRQ